MKRIVVVLTALAVLVLGGVVGMLAGLSSRQPTDAVLEATSKNTLRDPGAATSAVSPRLPVVVEPPIVPVPGGDGSALARSMQYSIYAKDVRDSAARVRAVVERNGGTVYSLALGADTFSLNARIPIAKAADVNTALNQIGVTEAFASDGIDLSGSLAEIDASLRNLQAQEQVLVQQIEQTKNPVTTADLQRQLAAVRNQIDTVNANRRAQQSTVDTVSLSVAVANTHLGLPTPDEPSMLANASQKAGAVFLTVAGGLLIVAAAAAPLLAILVMLAVATRTWRRLHRRNATTAGMPMVQ